MIRVGDRVRYMQWVGVVRGIYCGQARIIWTCYPAPLLGGPYPLSALTPAAPAEGLDAEMRQVLAELALTSHGTTASWNSGGGGDGSVSPPGESEPPHETYAADYTEAVDDAGRARVLAAARAELVRIKRRDATFVREETVAELDERIIEKLDQRWTVAEVAISLRCTETRVRRAVRATTTTAVKELSDQGMTVRGIAMRTGLSKSEVQRRLKDAA